MESANASKVCMRRPLSLGLSYSTAGLGHALYTLWSPSDPSNPSSPQPSAAYYRTVDPEAKSCWP